MPQNLETIEAIDAANLHFSKLNEQVRALIDAGCKKIVLNSVCGQRYIASAAGRGVEITINGTPGNDLSVFMNGTKVIVNGSAQDCTANTMNSGEIVIHGRCGDTLGHGMRGGQVYVRDDVGTRVGIHMKSYLDNYPVIVIGGTAGNFLGEYMAGGILIVLGINGARKKTAPRFIGTGMHGGSIYIRGKVDDFQLGKEVKVFEANDKDMEILTKYISRFCEYFGTDLKTVFKQEFIKLEPFTHRPYGRVYSY